VLLKISIDKDEKIRASAQSFADHLASQQMSLNCSQNKTETEIAGRFLGRRDGLIRVRDRLLIYG
jgi:hypothetical protein